MPLISQNSFLFFSWSVSIFLYLIMEQDQEGYHKLASLIGAHPHMGMYRRFGGLNALNALYLQAELIELEDELKFQAVRDMKSDCDVAKTYSRDWFTLSRPIVRQNEHSTYNPQWRTMLNIREKLKEYSMSIFGQALSNLIRFPIIYCVCYLQLNRWFVGAAAPTQ